MRIVRTVTSETLLISLSPISDNNIPLTSVGVPKHNNRGPSLEDPVSRL